MPWLILLASDSIAVAFSNRSLPAKWRSTKSWSGPTVRGESDGSSQRKASEACDGRTSDPARIRFSFRGSRSCEWR